MCYQSVESRRPFFFAGNSSNFPADLNGNGAVNNERVDGKKFILRGNCWKNVSFKAGMLQ